MAQTMWAFIGAPGEAKDRLREIPRSRSNLHGAYRQVFFPEIQAERLRLPWLVYERVQDEWKSYSDRTGKRTDERAHGRLHVLWLIGRSIVQLQGASAYRDVPIARVNRLTETLDEWFTDHHRVAVETITYVVEVKQDSAKLSGIQVQLR